MDRKLNYLFSFLLVIVFIFAANAEQHRAIILGMILAYLFAFLAFIFRLLTLDGMFAAVVVGTFVFGLGGLAAAAIVLLFFITSVIFSNYAHEQAVSAGGVRRDGLQVWANAFWLVASFTAAAFFNHQLFLIAGLAAIATSTADTWATELGNRDKKLTLLITNFRHVEPGTDGGISPKGSLAALAGSMMIGLAAVYFFSLHFSDFIYIFLAGFLGCFSDSYLGAVFQQNKKSVSLPFLQKRIEIDNNLVNGISTGIGALLAVTLKLIFT